jgi:hypothetical protein
LSNGGVYVRAVIDAVAEQIEGMEPPIYRIDDASHVQLDLGMMAVSLAEETRQRPGSASDPRICCIGVTHTRIAQFAAQAAGQEQYGGVRIDMVESLDEALHIARTALEGCRTG